MPSITIKTKGNAQNNQIILGLKNTDLIDVYRLMLLSRKLDEKQITFLKQGKQFFHIGAPGHEAAQIAIAKLMRPGYDWAYPYYRDIAFALGFGETAQGVLLEALHRADGPSSGGRAMPGHYGNRKLRIPSQSSCTGTQFLQAVGTAMGIKKEKTDEVVYVSSGEGTTSEGEFWEALNWSTREKFPVIFHIQNNKYAISVPLVDQIATGSIYTLTEGFKGLNRYFVDGTNFFEVYGVAKEAIEKARRGEGPALIESDVVRLFPHSSSDDQRKYRTADELEMDKKRDPIPKFEKYLIENEIVSAEQLKEIQENVIKEVNETAEWVEAQQQADPSTVEFFVYSDNEVVSKENFIEKEFSGPNIVLVDAINHALAEELERNPKMLIYGEDVAGDKGGVFTVTKGLTAKFGNERVFNSPLAEASIVGTAIGLSLRGWKPVVEIQFGDYIWPAFMQIRNELSMMRYRSNNTWSVPVVIRVPVGGYIHGGLYHSQSIESFFTHIPGLRVVFPSNAADAKGLLKTSIRCDDPVLFLEHKGLYRQSFAATPEPDSEYLIPFGLAKIKKSGEDITIVTYGMMVQRSLEAAKKLEERGFAIEVIDLRTLNPLDKKTIFDSVKKTGKLLIVHEETLFSGFGGEIAAIVSNEVFEYLDAPIMRVAAKDTPVPYAPKLEYAMLPQTEDIVKALEKLAQY